VAEALKVSGSSVTCGPSFVFRAAPEPGPPAAEKYLASGDFLGRYFSDKNARRRRKTPEKSGD
jgi:hypothetical protein